MRILILGVLLLASVGMAQDQAAIAKAKSACGPDEVHFDFQTTDGTPAVVEPEPGKARIYVIGRDNRWCGGCAIIARVGLNGAWIGAINGKSYLTASVEPAEHHLCTNWQSQLSYRSDQVALANFTAEAGKTYYFRIRLLTQATGPALLDLDAINSDEGRYLVLTSETGESHVKK
jgi:uncharacterized protein DUF2846